MPIRPLRRQPHSQCQHPAVSDRSRPAAASSNRVRPLVLAARLLIAGTSAVSLSWAAQAQAQQAAAEAVRQVSIPAGSLAAALNRFADETGVFLSASADLTEGRRSEGLSGSYTIEQGFAQLLRGHGLQAVRQADGNYALRPSAAAPVGAPVAPAAAPAVAPTPARLPEVTVSASAESPSGLLPVYAGGQIARGGRVGMLGNRDVLDTPFSQTSYTAQLIEDTQARTMADVFKNDASIVTTAPSNSGWDGSQSRGFSIGDTTDSISFNGLYGILPYYSVDVGIAERIEVFRGPSALLNGMPLSNSTGGSVDIVSKRAQDEPTSQITLGYASRSQGSAAFNVGRRFGDDKRFGLHLNGNFRDGEGAIRGSDDRLRSAMLGLDFRVSNAVRLSADIGYQERRLTGQNRPLFLDTGVNAPASVPSNTRSYLPSWMNWHDKSTFGMVRGEFDISENLSGYAAYGMSRYRGTSVFMNPVLQSTAGDFTATAFSDGDGGGSNTSSGTAGLRYRLDTGPVRHRINLNYSRIHRESYYSNSNGTPSSIASNIFNPADLVAPTWTSDPPYKSGEQVRSSVGVSDTLSVLDERLQLTVGVRKQNVSNRSFNSSGATSGTPYASDAWSPAYTLLYRFADRASAYVNYIEGLQPGTVVGSTYSNQGEIFPPYQSKQYEAGLKFDLNQRVLATISAYQIRQPNTLSLPTQPRPTLVLDGEQRNRGIDLSVIGEPIKGLRVTGGLSYLDARLTKTQGGLTDGMQAIAASKWKFLLAGDWDVDMVPGLAVSARVRYVNKAYINNTNTFSVPAYSLWDAGLRYRFQPFPGQVAVARLNIDNLLNKNFWMAYTNGGVIQPMPRTVKLSVSLDL